MHGLKVVRMLHCRDIDRSSKEVEMNLMNNSGRPERDGLDSPVGCCSFHFSLGITHTLQSGKRKNEWRIQY
jgi:hypothetical protein